MIRIMHVTVPTDQPNHRHIDVEAQQPCLRVWEHGQKCMDDYRQVSTTQLMQREPLAKNAVRIEPRTNGGKMFARIESARAIAVGMEDVRDNDVVKVLTAAHISTRV